MKLNKDQLASLWGDAGHFLLDIVKLIIGGVLLAGIMKEDLNRGLLYGVGSFLVVIMTVLAFAMLWWSKSKRKE